MSSLLASLSTPPYLAPATAVGVGGIGTGVEVATADVLGVGPTDAAGDITGVLGAARVSVVAGTRVGVAGGLCVGAAGCCCVTVAAGATVGVPSDDDDWEQAAASSPAHTTRHETAPITRNRSVPSGTDTGAGAPGDESANAP